LGLILVKVLYNVEMDGGSFGGSVLSKEVEFARL